MRRFNKAVLFLTMAALLFGLLPATALAATAAQSSVVVSNTVPAKMTAGSTCVVTITVKNTGKDTWTAEKGYTLKAVGGSDPFTGVVSISLGKTESIKTNQTKKFTVTMKAPVKAGTYKTDWRMYKGKVAFGTTFVKNVSVITLKSMAITTPAKKLTYYVGDKLDLTGLVVTGTYSDGSKRTVAVTAANVMGFSSSKPATNQTLTITVGGVKTSYKINVLALILNSIAVTTPAKKLTYHVGDALDLTGLVVTGTYNNGSKRVLAVSSANVTGFNSSKPVTGQTLTITVSGKTTTYKINVVAVKVASVTIEGNVTVVSGRTLQLNAAVKPADATDKGVAWSVVSGPGSIDDTGLLTATGVGTIEVKAMAKDGSLASDTREITSIHPLYNIMSDPQNIDPVYCLEIGESEIVNTVFEGLTKITSDMVPGPGIAESWDVSPDGTIYTFHLRDGAKWSDGQAVTAGDFYFAWLRTLDPQTAAPYSYLLSCVVNANEYANGQCGLSDVGIEAVDSHTFKVTLAYPVPYFLQLCAMPSFAPEREDIVNAHPDWATDPQTYVGDGPFQLVSWDHGASMQFVKNQNYWNKGKVNLDGMYWSIIPDAAEYMAAWNAGNVDIIESPPASDIPQLTLDKKLTVEPSLGTYYLELNTAKAPFDNEDFRKALALAINRNTLVNTTLQGGQLPADALVPPGIRENATTDFYAPGQFSDISSSGDVSAAQGYLNAYLTASGLDADDITITYEYNNNATHAAVAQAIKAMWENNLGIHVNLLAKSWRDLNDDVTSGNYDVARAGWIADYADPMTFLDMWTTDNQQNVVGFSDQNYDDKIAAAQNETDPAKRMQDLHQAEADLMDAMPVVPIFYYTNTLCISPDVKGVYKTPTGMLYFDDAALTSK